MLLMIKLSQVKLFAFWSEDCFLQSGLILECRKPNVYGHVIPDNTEPLIFQYNVQTGNTYNKQSFILVRIYQLIISVSWRAMRVVPIELDKLGSHFQRSKSQCNLLFENNINLHVMMMKIHNHRRQLYVRNFFEITHEKKKQIMLK